MDSTVIFLSLITILLTGLNGLIAFSLLALFSKSSFGRDVDSKHGLSAGKSRLGGIAITLSILFGCIVNQHFVYGQNTYVFIPFFKPIIVLSLLVGLIGLAEDLNPNISSAKRLILMIFFVFIGLNFMPELVPYNMQVYESIGINEYRSLIFTFTIIMICGFINAGNIADGANGLLTSIYFGFFLVAYSIDSSIFNFSVLTSLLAFIVFNVSTGRIFLGDFGAYFLSALVAYKCLEFYSQEIVNIFFMATLLVYPCFEITRSLVVRSIRSASVMKPDNNHLHNYLNEYILKYRLSQNTANSLTGLTIGFTTTIAPITLYFSGFAINSNIWIILFLVQFSLLSLIYIFFKKNLKI